MSRKLRNKLRNEVLHKVNKSELLHVAKNILRKNQNYSMQYLKTAMETLYKKTTLPLECDEKQIFTGSKELVLSNKES